MKGRGAPGPQHIWLKMTPDFCGMYVGKKKLQQGRGGAWYVVLVFKGTAPRSQFLATVASGAPPRLNHACCEEGVHVWFETVRRRGGGGGILGDPQTKGYKIRIGCLSPASQRPKSGRKCYVTPAFSSIPKQRGQNQDWLPNPCLLGAHKWAEMLHHPCIFGDPQQRGQNQSTKKNK